MSVRRVKETLRERRGNLRCREVAEMLEGLGFEVRDGRRGGHKVFVHDGLPEFHSGSFNCGHGKNREIKPAYIDRIVKTISMHEAALKAYLGEETTND